MKKHTKAIISSGLVSSIVYTGLMALFDYHEKQPFNIWKTIYDFVSFGILMAILTLYNLKKISKKDKM